MDGVFRQPQTDNDHALNFDESEAMHIGNSELYGNPFNGQMKLIKYYDRELSATEIEGLCTAAGVTVYPIS